MQWVLAVWLVLGAVAQAVAPLSGPPLARALAAPLHARMSGTTLRRGLTRLAESQGVGVFLDRRIDPDQPLDIQWEGVTVRAGLEQLATQMNLGHSFLGPVAYFGPVEAASELRTLGYLASEQVRRLPPAARERFQRLAPSQWDELTSPRDLVQQWCRTAQVTLEHPEALPHDLWAAGRLPPMTLTDRMTLALVGFDRTFQISRDGQAIRLRPITRPVRIARTYPGGSRPQERQAAIARVAAEAVVTGSAGGLLVEGRWEDHEAIAAVLAGRRISTKGTPRPVAGGRQVHTLNVRDQPLRPLLAHLAQRLGLKIQWDETAIRAAGVSLTQRVSFQAERVSVEKLLDAALGPAGLTYRRDGETFVIVPQSD